MSQICGYYYKLARLAAMVILFALGPIPTEAATAPSSQEITHLIQKFSSYSTRKTGTDGSKKAADFIEAYIENLGVEVGRYSYTLPHLDHTGSRLILAGSQTEIPLRPMHYNAISPQATPPEGISGQLIYAETGRVHEFNGKEVQGAIVLLDIYSGKNWLNAASLGAQAVIFIDDGSADRRLFEEKQELSPIQLPCFWLPRKDAEAVFGSLNQIAPKTEATIHSSRSWKPVSADNIYAIFPGSDPELSNELIIVEAFYDNTSFVDGVSPGADESTGIATLLLLAGTLQGSAPARSVMLVATSGHGQALAGLRDLVWSFSTKSKELKKLKKQLQNELEKNEATITFLEGVSQETMGSADGKTLQQAIESRLKIIVDDLSRQLMQLRMASRDGNGTDAISSLASQRFMLRQLSWRTDFSNVSSQERNALFEILPLAAMDNKNLVNSSKRQLKQLKKAKRFRNIVNDHSLKAMISLHLSSHGDGFGAFNKGWLYSLKPQVKRVSPYSRVDGILREFSHGEFGDENLLVDSLRPSRIHPWETYLPDTPALGGEVSALAGILGFTLATVNDARSDWGTPYDLPHRVNHGFALDQSNQIAALIHHLAQAPKLEGSGNIRNGFSTVSGKTNLLLHGELFPSHSASGTILMATQGKGIYHIISDASGRFLLKGVADKKHVLDKVIFEGYKYNDISGVVQWAIDKKQSGKEAYRLKIRRRSMKTDLVMFGARQTTLFNLLEPRSLKYMTKIQILDGRRESQPMKYWFSRIDSRSSIIASIFLEPGTYLKMTLSDSVLSKKLILTNGSKKRPEGSGYLVDQWPAIHNTPFRVAGDMWRLLVPRIANLEERGIFNERIDALEREGVEALEKAKIALKEKKYAIFSEQASKSWALATRVYDDVEKTQKDVLLGVLFYIALFVPFAFCMERLLFGYANIYKRIIAFCVILCSLIAVIYNVHPAFQLAYSPMVVVLAFFIIGLSLMVTLIIFFRFEEEMTLLQRKARHMRPEEISRGKAFVSAFFLGVSNLRRHRVRTALTCTTLIILTFTIMSFTSVKSMRHHSKLFFSKIAPYHGLLLKKVNWGDFPPEALTVFENSFQGKGTVAPRIWMENQDRTLSTVIPLKTSTADSTARGLLGLSVHEPAVTGIDSVLIAGTWLSREDAKEVLLPDRIADHLGIDLAESGRKTVLIWGEPYTVKGVFSSEKLQRHYDLDGELLTPVTFPKEVSMEMTEVEMEAMESGEDIRSFQSRYQHIPAELTLILPTGTLLSMGGHLKGVAVKPAVLSGVDDMARDLGDRFGIAIFAGGKKGTYLYNASDAISYSGVPNIVVPLLISIFIVLNTMIGSVYERKREIGIYTSVGLAPSHVSFLFIAESLAFAVISVVLGYLFAQTSAKLFAETSLWAGITVNYSSMSGVAAMLLVIAVVLISVIYPSRVAAEIAIPDVNRSWSLPEAENQMTITLPFLMKYAEHESIGGFIYSYFYGHQDCSHGIFSAGEIDIVTPCAASPGISKDKLISSVNALGETGLHLKMKIWLAPFDFGIMQWIDVQFCTAAEEGDFLEIKVRIVRESGEANAWRRVNKIFLRALRKQLLVWRSLDQVSHERYTRLLRDRQTLSILS
jgi:hypothetical protein